ncbi:hypothetical protein MLD38_000002 [Melastoma candidum]|uniref:Uncharacterized protein n=1 Tax=Melastoma candidum TaxID=119954 RepID=A0ACB9S9I2_9MYRT|nr:hypothetical protein MLD38_000002 [Melastoma candidum]
MLEGRLLCVFGVFLALCATLASPGEVPQLSLSERFGKWKALHGRVYANSDEEEKRLSIFKKSLDLIDYFNNNGSNTYKLGINQFADRTDEEIREANHGFQKNQDQVPSSSTSFRYASTDLGDVPVSLNWVDSGAVTEVKNKEDCIGQILQ